jgi:hypothetical protein
MQRIFHRHSFASHQLILDARSSGVRIMFLDLLPCKLKKPQTKGAKSNSACDGQECGSRLIRFHSFVLLKFGNRPDACGQNSLVIFIAYDPFAPGNFIESVAGLGLD